jgi:hypothetical protein
LYGLHQIQLRAHKTQVGQVDVFSSGRVGTWCPKQSLIQRFTFDPTSALNLKRLVRLKRTPRADHYDRNVRLFGGRNGIGETGLIVGPQLAALCEVDGDIGSREDLLCAVERGDAVERGVEKDVVAELRVNRVSFT